MFMKIAVLTRENSLLSSAEQLASRLHLPCVSEKNAVYDAYLVLTSDYLGLETKDKQEKSLAVDFLSGAMRYRLKSSGKKQLLAKSVGLNKYASLRILDATPGLGHDAFVLSYLGGEVECVERSPIVGALLADAIARAKKAGQLTEQSLRLIIEDAKEFLQRTTVSYDVIYLDPMFPDRTKSALNKKAMRVLAALVGNDGDADALLNIALEKAVKRVVVKRPRLAPALKGPSPTYTIKGTSLRFDIYLI